MFKLLSCIRGSEQLQAMSEERNDALLKMTNAQEQAKLNAESLKNLQTVLEQFQRGTSLKTKFC